MSKTNEKQVLFRNQYGQIQCHKCGFYSDIIYPVHLQNVNGLWVSMLCGLCQNGPPGSRVVQIDDPIDIETYEGPIEDG